MERDLGVNPPTIFPAVCPWLCRVFLLPTSPPPCQVGGREPAMSPCPQMKVFWRHRSMSVARAQRSRAPTPGTLSPPPTAPPQPSASRGCSWQEPRALESPGSCPCPTPPLRGSRGLSLRLFPFLTRVQNNNNHNSGSEGHAETKASRLRPVGPAAGLWGAAGLARSVQQGGRLCCGRPFPRNAERPQPGGRGRPRGPERREVEAGPG